MQDFGDTFVAGSSSGTVNGLVITDGAGPTPQTNGTAIQSSISLSSNSIAFGAQPIGSTTLQSVTVTNTGSGPVQLQSIRVQNPIDGYVFFYYGLGSCSSAIYTGIAPGTSCTIQVIFSPYALGQFTGNLSIYTDAPGSPQVISLSGSGAPAANLIASRSGVQFVAQKILTLSAVQTITLLNFTAGAVSNVTVSISGANAADFMEASTCAPTIAQNASCAVTIAFYPQMMGNRAASLTVTSDLGTQSFSLSGTGTITGALEIVNSLTGKALDVSGGSKNAGASIQQNSVSGLPQQQWTPIPVPGGYYQIANVLSGKVLDVTGESTADGAAVQQYDYLGAANQQWELIPVDDVHYKIVNRLSNKVLDVSGGSAASGTGIQQWDYVGNPQQLWVLLPAISYNIANTLSGNVLDVASGSSANGASVLQSSPNGTRQQQWQFMPVGGRFYAILDVLSGKVLDVTGESTADGTSIQQWDYLGGPNQQWQIVPATAVTVGATLSSFPRPGFNFRIVNRLTGKVLDDTASSTSSRTLIQQWDDLGRTNQQWQLTPLTPYTIVSSWSGLALDVPGGSTANGTPIQQWAANGNLQQQWQLVPVGGGYYGIVNSLTTKALEVTGNSVANGALIDEGDFTSAPNQLWQLIAHPYPPYLFSYSIVNKQSGKVLDETGYSDANGTLIQQWDDLSGYNQRWTLIAVPK